jgi:hypothetical protein
MGDDDSFDELDEAYNEVPKHSYRPVESDTPILDKFVPIASVANVIKFEEKKDSLRKDPFGPTEKS